MDNSAYKLFHPYKTGDSFHNYTHTIILKSMGCMGIKMRKICPI